MDHPDPDRRYFRILETALGLIAFARARPDAPDYVLVAHFMHVLLEALAAEEEQAVKSANPSMN
jgi:hypothetical protein